MVRGMSEVPMAMGKRARWGTPAGGQNCEGQGAARGTVSRWGWPGWQGREQERSWGALGAGLRSPGPAVLLEGRLLSQQGRTSFVSAYFRASLMLPFPFTSLWVHHFPWGVLFPHTRPARAAWPPPSRIF